MLYYSVMFYHPIMLYYYAPYYAIIFEIRQALLPNNSSYVFMIPVFSPCFLTFLPVSRVVFLNSHLGFSYSPNGACDIRELNEVAKIMKR